MDVKKTEIINCCACGSSNLDLITKLNNLPQIGVFCLHKEEEKNYPRINNNFLLCKNCGHGQLSHALDPSFLYNTGFQHCTSCSMSASQANDWFYDFVKRNIKRKFNIVAEIGVNDSYCLRKFAKDAKKVIGIDPILKGKEKEFIEKIPENLKEKFVVIGDLIENVDFLNHVDKKPDLYISNFVFEHIKDPVNVIKSLIDNADDEALIVIGVPGSEYLYSNSRFDQLSHQHYQQFTQYSLKTSIERAGGEILDMDVNFQVWGQIVVAFKRKRKSHKKFESLKLYEFNDIKLSYENFQNQIQVLKKKLRLFKDKKIFGFGAAQNFPIFSNFYQEKFPFDFILDDHPLRAGRFFPNLPYKIIKPDDNGYKGSVGIITAPDYARVLIPRMSQLKFDHIISPFNN